MTDNQPETLIDLLEEIHRHFDSDKSDYILNCWNFNDLNSETIKKIEKRLNINLNQVMLFTAVFSLASKDREVTTCEIAHYLNFNSFGLLRMQNELNDLCNRRMLVRERGEFSNVTRYSVEPNLFEKIVCDEIESEGYKTEEKSELDQLIDTIQLLFNERSGKFISIRVFKKKLQKLVNSFPNIKAVKEAEDLKLIDNDLIVFYDTFMNFIIEQSPCDLDNISSKILDGIDQKIRFRKNFLAKSSILFRNNIVDFEEGNYMEGRYLVFTPWFKEKILGDYMLGQDTKEFKPTVCKLIKPENIFSKKLYFEEKLNKGFEKINSAISEEKFNQICSKLEEQGLSKGITVMLYGHPGTGKTEMVNQLAKKSGREIFHVDISEIRNKFVGESEKRLRRVFEEYRKAVKLNKRHPILLFNESDALISKRMEVSHSVDQMENTMQNILLEELEKFEGIFFATTNLVQNLDSAFERRFLFKIKFEKPDVISRKRIWKEKLPQLMEEDAELLATNFEFSGGQIDNIVKKVVLESVIEGTEINSDSIKSFCEDELFKHNNATTKIGFSLF